MNETTENFWKAWAEPAPVPAAVFFRLYYNDEGEPLSYSMEHLPGNYIDIDAATYQLSSRNVRVVEGNLVHIKPKKTVTKLVPGIVGTPCLPSNVSIVIAQQQPNIKWSLKSHESD
tara:strand:+ start:1476 stop:1823 length:348 start_codon:yes stop_codon:yes gene_type:complete